MKKSEKLNFMPFPTFESDHLRFGDHFRSGIICGAVLILTQDSPIGGIDREKKQQTRTLRMLSAQFLRRT